MFSHLFFPLLLFSILKCNEFLTNGIPIVRTISPEEILNFTFQIEIENPNVIVELGAPTSSVFLIVQPEIPLQPYSDENTNYISSFGEDINGIHSSGSICPSLIQNTQNLNFSVITSSNQIISFTLLVSELKADLTESLTVSNSLCCTGSESLVSNYYFYYIPQDISFLEISGSRSSNRTSFGSSLSPNLLLRYNDCPTGSPLQTDYIFELPNNGDFSIILDENSDPPLRKDLLLFLAPRMTAITQNENEDEIVINICPDGVCFNDSNSLESSKAPQNSGFVFDKTNLWVVQNSGLFLFIMMIYFNFQIIYFVCSFI